MASIAGFFVHSASVETYQGSGPAGDVYAAPVMVRGFLDDGLVRVDTGRGVELHARVSFYAALADDSKFVALSRVTVNGRTHQVKEVRRRDGEALGLPSHVEVDLL